MPAPPPWPTTCARLPGGHHRPPGPFQDLQLRCRGPPVPRDHDRRQRGALRLRRQRQPDLPDTPGPPGARLRLHPVDLDAQYTPPDVGAGTNATNYVYNLDRDLTQVQRPDGQSISLSYDAAGRLQTLSTPRGNYGYSYDATTGQLTGITAPGGGSLAYSYDGSLLTGTTWGGEVAGNVSRSYDNDFRIASISVNGADPVAYGYDGDSLLIQAGALSLTRDAQNGLLTGTSLGNVTDTLSYNAFGELADRTYQYSGADLYSTQYSYDVLGRITQKVETIQGAATTYDYAYDPAGRLAEVEPTVSSPRPTPTTPTATASPHRPGQSAHLRRPGPPAAIW